MQCARQKLGGWQAGLARFIANSRRLHGAGKRGLRRTFELGQHAGVDILPRHFYSQIPSIAELRANRGWRTRRDTSSIEGADIPSQLAFVGSCCTSAVVERMPPRLYERACAENGAVGFGPIEAQFLYCFIASRRPRRVVQIGCGVSTGVILSACRDFDHVAEIVCIDPYPTRFLAGAAEAGLIELIGDKAQDVGLDELTTLDPGDLLFVDSTHTVKPGSEVNRIVLDVLPRLAPSVYVHFHDIVFPYDYSPETLRSDLFFWLESVLLQAFLTQNARYALRVSLSMIHHAAPESLRELLPDYQPAEFEDGVILSPPGTAHFPSSAYLQVRD